MTQNTEQNVQTFDTQISMMAEFIRTGPSGKGLEGWLSAHIRAAEARGAAEERRKDGEGREIAGWRFRVEMCVSGKYTPWVLTDEDPSPWIKASGCHDRYQVEALHTHPANVAALEGRIAELEAAIQDYFDARVGCEIECVSRTGEPERRAKEAARAVLRAALRAALTREGGV